MVFTASGSSNGWTTVTLRDADDGDVIILDEDTIEALRDRLTQIIDTFKPTGLASGLTWQAIKAYKMGLRDAAEQAKVD